MTRVLFSVLLLTLYLKGTAQIPSTKETIQNFIDSIGKSNDRQVITSSIFPAFANGKNFTYRQNIWRNNKKELLWVETILPDSITTVYFYCRESLIFAAEFTDTLDVISKKRNDIFRNIFFYNSRIIDDSDPGRNNYKVEHYLEEMDEG